MKQTDVIVWFFSAVPKLKSFVC